jgi:predicted transcriptional regulator
MTHTEHCILLIKLGKLRFDNGEMLLSYTKKVDKRFPYWNQHDIEDLQTLICQINPAETPLIKRLKRIYAKV